MSQINRKRKYCSIIKVSILYFRSQSSVRTSSKYSEFGNSITLH